VNLHAGRNVIDLPIEIRQPKLWYPAGYGEQPLYEFTAQVEPAARRPTSASQSRPALHRASSPTGQVGPLFELVVNGIPVFAKGADVIPFDSFPNRVTTADYRRILESRATPT
jgi:beta-mannosidase